MSGEAQFQKAWDKTAEVATAPASACLDNEAAPSYWGFTQGCRAHVPSFGSYFYHHQISVHMRSEGHCDQMPQLWIHRNTPPTEELSWCRFFSHGIITQLLAGIGPVQSCKTVILDVGTVLQYPLLYYIRELWYDFTLRLAPLLPAIGPPFLRLSATTGSVDSALCNHLYQNISVHARFESCCDRVLCARTCCSTLTTTMG